MKHELPPLGFQPDALAPAISKETLGFHHGKHHKAYVDKLNALIQGTELENASLEEILQKAKGGIYNNAAQHFNHSLYWKGITPGGPSEPPAELAKKLQASFGSLESFRDDFLSQAKTLFGSGWCWLVHGKDGSLKIETTSNAKVPLDDERRPILTCDVWEHAYYLDYQNRRPDYADAWWRLVNWQNVAAAAREPAHAAGCAAASTSS